MLSSARSSVAPDVGAQAGRVSRSPLKRIPSPSKLGIPSSANGTHPGDHSQRLVPSNAHSGTHGASKANGRKRLYMDPREDEPEKARSGGDGAYDDRTAAFSLPKRQRVNTWGTDSQANVSISLSSTLPNLWRSFLLLGHEDSSPRKAPRRNRRRISCTQTAASDTVNHAQESRYAFTE